MIGVYEPLTVVASDGSRVTSLVNDPELAVTDQPIFHRDCHAVRSGPDDV